MIELNEPGLAEDTIVICTTDHGDWLGDHGLVLKGPMMYDGLMRVGLIMRGPGIDAGRVITDPVSTMDLRTARTQRYRMTAETKLTTRLTPPCGANWQT